MEINGIECPNWWEVIRWLFTSMAKNVNLGLCKQIQLVVRVGLERGALQLQVQCSYHLATLPSYKRSEWVYEVFHLMDQRWKSYAITADKSEKRTRLFLWYPYWLRKWSRGQGTHWCYYLYTCTACEYGHLLLLLATKDILQCWPPSWWNVLSSKEPGETAAFAGYWLFTLKILLSFFQS